MNNNYISDNVYIKTDKNKIINAKQIRWITTNTNELDSCLEVCMKENGCMPNYNTHKICKLYNLDNITHNNMFIKTDNDIMINEKHIKWIKKIDTCFHVCMKSNGCMQHIDTHKICKINNLDSYDILENIFNYL